MPETRHARCPGHPRQDGRIGLGPGGVTGVTQILVDLEEEVENTTLTVLVVSGADPIAGGPMSRKTLR